MSSRIKSHTTHSSATKDEEYLTKNYPESLSICSSMAQCEESGCVELSLHHAGDSASENFAGTISGRPSCSSGSDCSRVQHVHCRVCSNRQRHSIRQSALNGDDKSGCESLSTVFGDDSVSPAGYLQEWQNFSSHRKSTDEDQCLLLHNNEADCPARVHRRSAGGSNQRQCSWCRIRREKLKRVEKEVKRSLEKELKHVDIKCAAGKESNILGNLKAFFVKWLRDSKSKKEIKSDLISASGANVTDAVVDSATASSEAILPTTNGYLNLACPQFPQECTETDMQCLHNVISLNSSFDSDYLLHYYTNVSESLCSTGCSTSSFGTTLSTNTTGEYLQSCQTETFDSNPVDKSNWQSQVDYDVLLRRNPRLCGKQLLQAQSRFMSTIRCSPTKSKSLQSQHIRQQKELLCSSWPLSGKRIFKQDSEDEFNFEDDATCIIDSMRRNSLGCYQLQEYEFNIPYNDIKFNECIRSGKRKKLYRGQWHGEVMIYVYENLNHADRNRFWEDISRFSLIRHENIALFMGASMEPPNKFAVVTSPRKGPSLFDKIYILRDKTASSFKLSVLQQVAQAVGYLHAKGMIAAQRLNSKNIFLEPRAKLCLLDWSINEDEEERCGYVSVSQALMYYTAPEILATCPVHPPRLIPESALTISSDVFAFSIIMFEVYYGRYPFHKLDYATFVDYICQGKREEIRDMRTVDPIKHLIQDCWAHDPLYRPEFVEINQRLKDRAAVHKRHSSSEPDNLHRLHFSKFGSAI